MKHLREDNRRSWNAATRAHQSHKADQAKFLREGGEKLFPEEIELLGDVRGKQVAHLQCNAGQDSLCIARRGASVVGVDISDDAIELAKQLAADAGIEASFVRDDIYDFLDGAAAAGDKYDIVFSSYGAYPWLSDVGTWASGIARILKPGGRFVLVEFHPIVLCFDEGAKLAYSYFSGARPVTSDEGIGDYVAKAGAALAPSGFLEGVRDFKNPHKSHEFLWGVGDIVSAVVDADLRIETLREYPYSNGCPMFDDARPLPGRRWGVPEGMPEIPQMFALVASRP